MGGWTSLWCIFITNTQWVKVFGWWQTLFYWQKCEEESVWQTGGQTPLDVYLRYFFSSCKLSKTVTVSALLLFGHVTLFCGTYFLSWVKDLCSNQTVRLTLVYPFTLVRFTNNAPLILPPEVYQRWSKISPPRDSHTGWGGELAQDTRTRTAVWMGPLLLLYFKIISVYSCVDWKKESLKLKSNNKMGNQKLKIADHQIIIQKCKFERRNLLLWI